MEQVTAFLLPSEGWHSALGVPGAAQEALSLSLVDASWEQHDTLGKGKPQQSQTSLRHLGCGQQEAKSWVGYQMDSRNRWPGGPPPAGTKSTGA